MSVSYFFQARSNLSQSSGRSRKACGRAISSINFSVAWGGMLWENLLLWRRHAGRGSPAVGTCGWMRLKLRILLPTCGLTGRLQPVLQRYLKVLKVPLPLRGLGPWGGLHLDGCASAGGCLPGGSPAASTVLGNGGSARRPAARLPGSSGGRREPGAYLGGGLLRGRRSAVGGLALRRSALGSC